MLTIIGVGPGDPELLTLKAVRCIREADEIALVDSGAKHSAVAEILGDLIAGKPVLRLPMPMRGGRESWREAHAAAAQALSEALEAGRKVAYPVLGDPSLYATSSYLAALLKDRFEVAVVPGISTVFAAAARAGIPLAEADEPLTILPGLPAGQALPEGNVAVMKAADCLDEIALQAKDRPCTVFRNLGMPGEYIGDIAGAKAGQRSYFTTVLVKKG